MMKHDSFRVNQITLMCCVAVSRHQTRKSRQLHMVFWVMKKQFNPLNERRKMLVNFSYRKRPLITRKTINLFVCTTPCDVDGVLKYFDVFIMLMMLLNQNMSEKH